MLRRLPVQIVLALPLVFAIACGGAQKKAEVPDFTEKGWSGPSNDTSDAKADPAIQATPPKGDDSSASKPSDKAMVADKPEPTSTTTTTSATASSGSESDAVASGNALPPSPKAAGKAAAKPGKAKKKSKKKKAQQS